MSQLSFSTRPHRPETWSVTVRRDPPRQSVKDMREQNGPFRGPRKLYPRVAVCTALLLGTGCVRWQTIPNGGISARALPRWVQLTTRDSVHYMLEDARIVAGDTLVGRPEHAATSVRLPLAEIAHLEARVPSGPGSIGVGIVVIAVFFGLWALIGQALGGWD